MDNMTAVADPPSVYFRCWTVRCKTEGCNTRLFLDVIGPRNRALHALIPPSKPFTIGCPECTVNRQYGQSDLEERDWENPPKGHCKEFRDALVSAREET
jgi:hypothetical protein